MTEPTTTEAAGRSAAGLRGVRFDRTTPPGTTTTRRPPGYHDNSMPTGTNGA